MDFANSCLTGLLFMGCNVYAAGTGTALDPFQLYVKQGYEAVLQCSFESARLIWSKYMIGEWSIIANQDVTINDTKYKTSINPNTGLYYKLHVLNTQSADEGIYRCRGGITDEYFLQLTFYGKKMHGTCHSGICGENKLVPEELSSLTIQNDSTDNRLIGTEGRDLLIECEAVGGNPAPSVSLVVLGTKVQTSVKKVQYFVQSIPRIYDQTNISCEANSDALDTPMTTTTIIYLNLMPLVSILNASFVNTLEMVPFSLSFVSTGSCPTATLWWTVGQTDATFEASSQEKRDSDESYTVTSTLTYVVDRKYNLQPITCKANNTVGGFSNKISLFVRFAPDVSVSNVTYEMKDSTRTIYCTADGYPDTYTFYKWQHKSVHGRFIRELDGENILTLPVVPTKIRYQDNGEYVCTVSNGIQGKDRAEKRKGAARIIAYAQPVITFDNEERRIQYGEIGKSVEIVVHVYSVPKYYYHTWFNNGKQIQLSTNFFVSESSGEVEDVFHGMAVKVNGYVLKLTINDAINEDSSNSTLILGNGVGQLVKHTVLLKLSTPQTSETLSSGVIIGAVTGSLISLLIILDLSFVIVKKRRNGDRAEDIQPYQFEPELSEGSSEDDEDLTQNGDVDMEPRLGNTNWCDCGHCESMPTANECICCQELNRMTDKMEELPSPTQCITEHPGFEPVCLNQYVLETAYYQYRQQYGEIQVTTEERNRYTAYRQLARWGWGYLGKSVRVRLPACATIAIRNKFQSNQYKGFEEA
ncbi:unnamed protein product [Mytilus coruscus]|uniref:Ig-like domain-containing protein n=1 Tax=Mytilus coruscus TaxID=42192 RepID=A0A6J7ZZY2_MYTCO|nr:unnamed protein product [Mytilus coruscus]